ncbi:ABC transporter ATP-binding protein/permease [Candidatus Symbiopectobacterium sp. NZEC135]|uniref:ABC transporter ATP-binding protein/permease n=1 Tax=Candidatus Symbiopectobacterium sp. NZEC135 TaxID=2820471 RepID=UPI00222629BE|nr:ABC transporter ATP-binding protein/permease [Candidatus Symbiopectobacterium sp. NZEC135]MCW2479941.1 ABC transporter ATP-binding protein/permease [Candidatus Symbiopectobacterium sp. NZEC135]
MSALWALCRPFWGGWRSWRAWSLLAVAVSMGFGIVYLNVQINEWSRVFYDTLGTYDSSKLFGLMKEYTIYILLYIGVFVYQDWFTSLLVIRWRSALTAQFVDSWLAKCTFYRMSLTGKIDNPDQRIAEDINLFTDKLVSMVVAFLINAGRLSSFMVILWQLSGVQRFTLFGREWAISGYLVWVVIIYTVVGTLITHVVGKKLHGISYARQRSEANFRAALLRKHDNAEQIALYGGEAQEKTYLARHFSEVAHSWRQLMDTKRNMGFFTSGYMRVSLIVPIFAALPAFLTKTVTLGGLMQIRSAFSQVHGALSWFIHMYVEITMLSASIQRLIQFKQEIDRHQPQQAAPEVGECLSIENLSFATPQGTPLLNDVALHCAPGSWSKLSGPSGLGKSTLLRTLNGLWPYYRGQWQAQAGRSLLLPQKSYLGQGTLAEVLCYPHPPLKDVSIMQHTLERVGLGEWCDRLAERHNWDRIFSGGEQQRLAFARALIAKPDTLYLDEATSSLDHGAARALLSELKQALPACTVIAITHQGELDDLFPHHYDLTVFRAVSAG